MLSTLQSPATPAKRSRAAGRRARVLAGFLMIALSACTDAGEPAADQGDAASGQAGDIAVGPATSQSESPGSEPRLDLVAPLAGGHFESPLVQLKRLQGQVGHLHIDEVRYRPEDKLLFQCSYTFGVINAEDPATMSYVAENLKHAIPDDERTPGCVHLAYDGNIVYTTHRGNLRNPTFVSGWDISVKDPADTNGVKIKPAQIPVLQEPGVSYEGIDVADSVVYVAIREDGLAAYRRDPATNALSRIGDLAGLGNTWGVRAVGDRAYVTDIDGQLSIVDISNPEQMTLLGQVAIAGVPKGMDVEGDTVYVAAGSEGLAIVDASDPAAPKVLGTVDTPGPALRVDYADGHAFVAAWNDARVYDVSDPAAPHYVGSVRLTTDVAFPDDGHPPVTARTKGIAAEGDVVFVGNWWVPYAFRLNPDRAAPNLRLPEEVNLMDFGLHPAGQSGSVEIPVVNQGTAPLAVYDAWTTSPAFAVNPSQLALAPGETGTLTVSYTATDGERETGILRLRTDDPLQPVRSAFLVGNQTGLGLGQPLPKTSVDLIDGGEWSSEDAEGKVLVLAYFATFCPVCAEHMPELERHFWHKYKDQGVEIIGIDSHDNTVEGGMEGVQDYIGHFGNTHPVGLESTDTPTYAELVKQYKGANPFPVDVVVGKDGLIKYITREYDPDGLEAAIEAALAE